MRLALKTAEGYAYIFPKRDHVNIGIGYVLSHYRERVAKSPYELQREFVATLRGRGIVEGDSVRNNFTPFIIPVGGPLPEPARVACWWRVMPAVSSTPSPPRGSTMRW